MPDEPTESEQADPIAEPIDPEPGRLEPISRRSPSSNGAIDGLVDAGARVVTPFIRLGLRTARGMGRRLGVNDAVRHQVDRALDSDTAARTTQQVLESDAANQVWDKVLESEQAQKLVERVAEAPEVRSAITSQGVGLLEDLRQGVRGVARRLDMSVERFARRLLRRQVRGSRPLQAGAVTRGAALLLDWAVVYGALLLVSAAIALLISVLQPGDQSAGTVAVAFGSLVWLLAGAVYLSFFWSAAGRTPGMAFLGIRVAAPERERIGPGQAVRRVIWLNISILVLMLGFWGVLFEERRRGWPDRRARTMVLYADPELDADLPGYAGPGATRR
jgi:uncharacterized RDD family membrane protein YckC